MNSFLKLFLWIAFSLICSQLISKYVGNTTNLTTTTQETFTNLANTAGTYPDEPLLLNEKEDPVIYPFSGKTEISSNTAADIWQYYPIFEVGSYAQITNNLKYPANPDNGKCTPASMCETLYLDRITGPSNEIHPLPPVKEPEEPSVRINYYIGKE